VAFEIVWISSSKDMYVFHIWIIGKHNRIFLVRVNVTNVKIYLSEMEFNLILH